MFKITKKRDYENWYVFNFTHYNLSQFQDMMNWLKTRCSGKYKKVGWDDGCSTYTGVLIQNSTDALLFKLTFVGKTAREDEWFKQLAIRKARGLNPEL